MPLILLTSSDRAVSFKEAGIERALRKPVRPSKLYNAITEVLAGSCGALDARDASSRGKHRVQETPAVGSDQRILLVEDNLVNQVVATRMLGKQGFRSDTAANGREALEMLAEGRYSTILMDCQMPEMDGYDATREIRRLEHASATHTPIIAMTANTMQGDRERCLAAGMDDYLSKPLRLAALKDALGRWSVERAESARAGLLHTSDTDGSPDTVTARAELLDEAVVAELEALGEKVLPELLMLYFRQAPHEISELKNAQSSADDASLARLAHKLKGSSNSIGATHVSKVAAELEACAKTKAPNKTRRLLQSLVTALDETEVAFRERRATPEPGGFRQS